MLNIIADLRKALEDIASMVDDLERQVVIANNKQYGKPNEPGVDPSKPAP